MKRILIWVITLSVLFAIPHAVYAHEIPQDRNDCSIEILVRYDGKNVDSGTLSAIKIASIAEDSGNYFFRQEVTGIRLENITSATSAAQQQKFYIANKSTYNFISQTQDVQKGKAIFTNLSTGLYLIVQNQAADGFHKMDSFLVSLPYTENGTYQYHVTAEIKSELERPEPDPTEPSSPPPKDPYLPQTSQLNWPIPLMAIAGLSLFSLGWILCFGKKDGCLK